MLNKQAVFQIVRELVIEIYEVSTTLFKIMIPALIIIKLLEEVGGITLLGQILEPVMGWVGLPESMGIVWATTILTNIYTGMLIFFTQPIDNSLTVAQITVLSGMMLMAHGLPVEARIAQKTGIRLGVTLILRIGGALVYGFLLNIIYSAGDWLQHPHQLIWQPENITATTVASKSLGVWAFEQAQGLLAVFIVICLLLTTLKLLRIIGFERLINWLLSPLLQLLKIGKEATTITMVGITLGLAFGGGLLIKEVNAGHIAKQDVFTSMGLLALCHSIIEDTLLVMLLGAHISGALWLRVAFALIAISLLSRWFLSRSSAFKERYLYTATKKAISASADR
ncbi:nucleoside recognition domain-containing protein [Alkalimarinus alittae]|uniref:Nucleoside transporter/FeoB GTPase Gate domain-containing protein n=1 Tax=Alkalimarinus alittae TaxID=2961619 RepID=A0ABY6MYZ2_9ALTE|nr:nucleoside recognition domain-containing protein [Alkalimarinus alittae]UZE95053.1 hypothetical protein NKI27_13365 [Alkalimarinus alittae]